MAKARTQSQAPWRQIVRRLEANTSHLRIRGKTLTWWLQERMVLTLECGHQKVIHGFSKIPKDKTRCTACAASPR